jgi:hypothetical protein
MRRWVRSEKGNTLIMMAGAMAVLAGFGILTIDIGRMLVTRTQLQNAADAGALAGAALYCEGQPTETEVKARAKLIADGNQALEFNAVNLDVPYTDILVEGVEGTDQHDVTVTTNSDTRQFLLGLFNIFQASNPDAVVPEAQTEAAVSAIATARCGATCGANCLKPWSPPDRWDDVTLITGHAAWRNDGRWNSEFDGKTQDQNGDGLYTPGEPFTDGNGNGICDEEAYHPSLTGYTPDPVPGNFLSPDGDLGLQVDLHFDNGNSGPVAGQYQSIRLPPVNKGTPLTGGDEYRENIARCNQAQVEPGDWLELETGGMVGPTNQGMRDLINSDPDASWDAATQSIVDSDFTVSPRVVLIPIYDPRVPVLPGHQSVLQVTKVAAFFMEEMIGQAEVRGRFIKVRAPGIPCAAGQVSFLYNLSLIR